jgi:hypothetical protein
VTDLATLTAIIYAARLQRRVPESMSEKRATIAASLVDAMLILEVANDDAAATTPELPPPSPGTIGRIAEAKAVRRRDEFGRWTTTGSE